MSKKIFIIAGEASGDNLGAKLLKEFNQLSQDQFIFSGVGGQKMIEQNFQSIFPMEDLSVMGFFEIVPHLKTLLSRISQTADAIIKFQPDYIITIDSPDFCFRVIKKIIKKGKNPHAKKIHLIAPSVWAYRENRAQKIAKLYDLLLAILPFEPPYFEKHGLKTVFIGYPLFADEPDMSKKDINNANFREAYKIPSSDKLILVTPGSRNGEVKKIFPEFIATINQIKKSHPNIKVVIPIVKKTQNLVKEMAAKIETEYFFIESAQKNLAYFACDFALAKSGTNAIEISMYQIPLIIAYKINILTHFIVKRMVKIKYANLLNLIMNKEIIPEFLQDNCHHQKISNKLLEFINNPEIINQQIIAAQQAMKIMGMNNSHNPMQKAVTAILQS